MDGLVAAAWKKIMLSLRLKWTIVQEILGLNVKNSQTGLVFWTRAYASLGLNTAEDLNLSDTEACYLNILF